MQFIVAIREIDGEIDQIKARDARGRETITQAMKSMDQNQEKLTRSRDRSRDQFWGYFWGIFEFMVEITNR